MLLLNRHPDHRKALETVDARMLGASAADKVERFLAERDNHRETPLRSLEALAASLGVASIHVKDESFRLGLNSFKALGGSYAVIRLVLAEAAKALGREVDVKELQGADVRRVAGTMTVGCATDGNHGRSVAMGARMVGARAVIFVHSGVSDERVEAIRDCGAEIVRVEGSYDDSVAEAERVCAEKGWREVSDTSWPGYEHIPALVMQGYLALLAEAARQNPEPPTHVFVQAGVGGLAAAVAGHLATRYGADRPIFVVVEPDRAACLFESAKAGEPLRIAHGEPTIMAMLECYEPSLVAWRVLSRAADAFMTIGEDDAAETMRILAAPKGADAAIVAGESGAAALAGLRVALGDPEAARLLKLDASSRIFVINTEGATDKARYQAIVGQAPDEVLAAA